MWERAELKQLAKDKLRGNYWLAVAACAIVLILSSVFSFFLSGEDGSGNGLVLTLSTVWSIFVVSVLTVGMCYFFIRGQAGDFELTNIFAPFKRGYANTVVTMLLMGVFIFLWSLLLIIPGIIKAYAYRMVPFLIAEYPEMGYKQAFEISKQATNGEKMSIFVLDLSFIPWILLCIITVGLGFFFLVPYMNATYAELYDRLKTKAINQGIMSAGI